ncbi:flavin-dependent quinone reductase [Aspergillus vadensis CBS 113365]|uniref:FAD/NAD(P)-binding domain-containing protein n=1 Tax=Aspergillus vadensis (strain CBS 113365 / IMI 142717 / IBT 24658) TaxID=1448311 RepID=A0A319BLN2_ASPVC|nr:hypothetical protein BO88DRAFT_445420 [Aspergillus vadensis CBS 113365]PYH66573.1 hypothetical protein BO88DRAFT_445420 [Aspergillus vadensis CBS 113365]
MPPSIGLIICSQRTPRAGPQISTFIHNTIRESYPAEKASIKTIDLAEWNLPLYNESGMPSWISSADEYEHEHTKAWSREISRHEAFIFVTPQYNWGYPASVKNAIDYLFHEWKGKPALVVSYGGHGGGKAAEQLRQVLQGVRMRPLERMIGLKFPEMKEVERAARGEDLGLDLEGGYWVEIEDWRKKILSQVHDAECCHYPEQLDAGTRHPCVLHTHGHLMSEAYDSLFVMRTLGCIITYNPSGLLSNPHKSLIDTFTWKKLLLYDQACLMVHLFILICSLVGLLPAAAPLETITCDICILGGGSSGTYSAIQLKDAGKHVVVIEPNNRLGGHAQTLYLPDGNYVDYGVEGVFNNELSRDYFRRLGVDWKPLLPLNKRTDFVDFSTGERVDPPAGILQALVSTFIYRSSIKHWMFLTRGVYDLPDPVPEDLLRPFREFVEEHSLEAALHVVFLFSQNVGNLLDMPTLYAIQNFGVPQATETLGSDVLFQTSVVATNRSDSGVEVTVQHANGTHKLIKARNLLITFPPLMQKLQGFDLDETETELFQKWFWRTYYVAVVNNTGIPDKLWVTNTDPTNGLGSLPRMPFDFLLQYMGAPGHSTSKLVGDMNFTAEDARDLIAADFARMKAKGTYPIQDPQIVVFGDSSPETLMVSPEEIRNGFYRKF